MENYISEKTLIGDLVREYPEASEILLSIGMHCLGCPSARGESIEQACAVHGVDVNILVEKLNKHFGN